MLKIEKFVTPSPEQWEIIIEGMRNPKNSWDRMDSYPSANCYMEPIIEIGENDHTLMMQLADGGPVHAKYRRMIDVFVTINAPLYWWKEFDTYKVGTVCNSCSTMHKIHAKEFDRRDFSTDHLMPSSLEVLDETISLLNDAREAFLEYDEEQKEDIREHWTKKDCWWQMIQLLPTSYNQKRTIKLNYEVLHNIYTWRRNHKLDEWHVFCDWIEELPYSELIIGEREEPSDV